MMVPVSHDDEVSRALYEELRRLAARRMASEPSDHTLQPTALVHEAWLRLRSMESAFLDRTHFFASAATAMRRILIERARRIRCERHGGELRRVEMSPDQVGDDAMAAMDLLDLAAVLADLEARDPELATIATMRYVLGCTIEETADALGISPAKVKKDTALARAWLSVRLPGR